MTDWPEIAGLTLDDGRAAWPRRPHEVADALAVVVAGQGQRRADLLAQLSGLVDAERAAGLLSRLDATGVAVWGSDGALHLHPQTSVADLGLRLAAWMGSVSVAEDDLPLRQRLMTHVVEATRGQTTPVGTAADLPWSPPRATPDDQVRGPLAAKLQRLLGQLDQAFLERPRHLRAVLLCLLAGQHALLLGPPGTAKSLLARSLRGAFADAVWFEYLLSRFTHPDELFGPVSIPGLKDEDYRRLTEGFLPTAHVAFLDEVFKANSAILNALLTLINERVFHHGRHLDKAPLLGLVGASNELPDPDAGLGALWDRFLVRLSVAPLQRADSFLAVATGTVPLVTLAPQEQLTLSEVQALRAAADQVGVPDPVARRLVRVWRRATAEGWGVSDRRWRQAVGLLKVAAAAEGRTTLAPTDLLWLDLVLAPTPEDQPAVAEVLREVLQGEDASETALRAQWTLLQLDRVAPPEGQGWADPLPADLEGRRRVRRQQVDWMIVHLERAAAQGGTAGTPHHGVWHTRTAPEDLAHRLHRARHLTRCLEQAEAYGAALDDPAATTRALAASLPVAPASQLGLVGAALRVQVPSAGVEMGLTLRGERLDAKPAGGGFDFDTSPAPTPTLTLQEGELEALLRTPDVADALLATLPEWARRNAQIALGAARKRLGASGLPKPPAWPA